MIEIKITFQIYNFCSNSLAITQILFIKKNIKDQIDKIYVVC